MGRGEISQRRSGRTSRLVGSCRLAATHLLVAVTLVLSLAGPGASQKQRADPPPLPNSIKEYLLAIDEKPLPAPVTRRLPKAAILALRTKLADPVFVAGIHELHCVLSRLAGLEFRARIPQRLSKEDVVEFIRLDSSLGTPPLTNLTLKQLLVLESGYAGLARSSSLGVVASVVPLTALMEFLGLNLGLSEDQNRRLAQALLDVAKWSPANYGKVGARILLTTKDVDIQRRVLSRFSRMFEDNDQLAWSFRFIDAALKVSESSSVPQLLSKSRVLAKLDEIELAGRYLRRATKMVSVATFEPMDGAVVKRRVNESAVVLDVSREVEKESGKGNRARVSLAELYQRMGCVRTSLKLLAGLKNPAKVEAARAHAVYGLLRMDQGRSGGESLLKARGLEAGGRAVQTLSVRLWTQDLARNLSRVILAQEPVSLGEEVRSALRAGKIWGLKSTVGGVDWQTARLDTLIQAWLHERANVIQNWALANLKWIEGVRHMDQNIVGVHSVALTMLAIAGNEEVSLAVLKNPTAREQAVISFRGTRMVLAFSLLNSHRTPVRRLAMNIIEKLSIKNRYLFGAAAMLCGVRMADAKWGHSLGQFRAVLARSKKASGRLRACLENNIGVCLYQLGRKTEADHWFARAISKQGDVRIARLNHAVSTSDGAALSRLASSDPRGWAGIAQRCRKWKKSWGEATDHEGRAAKVGPALLKSVNSPSVMAQIAPKVEVRASDYGGIGIVLNLGFLPWLTIRD